MTTRTKAVDHRRGSRIRANVFRMMFRYVPEPRMRRMRLERPDVPIEELVVTGRRTGVDRCVLVSVLRVDGAWYVGHPNGDSAGWVRDLRVARTAIVRLRDGRELHVVPTELSVGLERDRVIEATGSQPAPAGPLYRRAQGHVRAVGSFFRLDPVVAPADDAARTGAHGVDEGIARVVR